MNDLEGRAGRGAARRGGGWGGGEAGALRCAALPLPCRSSTWAAGTAVHPGMRAPSLDRALRAGPDPQKVADPVEVLTSDSGRWRATAAFRALFTRLEGPDRGRSSLGSPFRALRPSSSHATQRPGYAACCAKKPRRASIFRPHALSPFLSLPDARPAERDHIRLGQSCQGRLKAWRWWEGGRRRWERRGGGEQARPSGHRGRRERRRRPERAAAAMRRATRMGGWYRGARGRVKG